MSQQSDELVFGGLCAPPCDSKNSPALHEVSMPLSLDKNQDRMQNRSTDIANNTTNVCITNLKNLIRLTRSASLKKLLSINKIKSRLMLTDTL